DLREHRRHRLTYLRVVDVTIVRAVHPDLEAVRITGVGEQLLRRRRVVGQSRVEVFRETATSRRDHQAGRGRGATHDGLGDRGLVDRLVERLADALVLERVLALEVRE